MECAAGTRRGRRLEIEGQGQRTKRREQQQTTLSELTDEHGTRPNVRRVVHLMATIVCSDHRLIGSLLQLRYTPIRFFLPNLVNEYSLIPFLGSATRTNSFQL
ncbi:hypothetical protein J6590_018493 [Homalodisca vitripennis]|nr:hypothetical protein J6590_018493 [Homalodisca vitripennis]